MSDEEQAQSAEPVLGKCSLTIRFADGDELLIQIKRTAPFEKIYKAVGANRGIDPASFQLLHDGSILRKDESCKMREFESEEIIDVLIKQVGGNF